MSAVPPGKAGPGRALCDALRGGAVGHVELEEDGLRVRAEVPGAGPYGAEVRSLELERAGADVEVGAVVDALAERVDYLPERLVPLEVEAERGVLRTRRDQVRGGEYYELEVRPGAVGLGRFRYDREAGERRPVPDQLSHRVLERLVDDLAGVLEPEPED